MCGISQKIIVKLWNFEAISFSFEITNILSKFKWYLLSILLLLKGGLSSYGLILMIVSFL